MTQRDMKYPRLFGEEDLPDDVWGVLRASALLEVGEFRVFEIAYQDWHGEAGEEKMIEKHFAGYMFNDTVPLWVRHFCKKVLKLDDEEALDPADFGIVRKPATRQQINKGLEAIMYIVVALIFIFLLGESASRFMQLQCLFPPCY